MKKFLFMIHLLPQMLFGIGMVFVEPKIGIAPYQSFESKIESETLNNFFDYGVDVYSAIPQMKYFELGVGAEIRRLHYLLSDKKNVGLFFTLFKLPTLVDTMLVARVGFLQNTHLEKTFYYALGIEKSIHRLVFQVLFDDMQIKNNTVNSHYRSVIFKVGIKI